MYLFLPFAERWRLVPVGFQLCFAEIDENFLLNTSPQNHSAHTRQQDVKWEFVLSPSPHPLISGRRSMRKAKGSKHLDSLSAVSAAAR